MIMIENKKSGSKKLLFAISKKFLFSIFLISVIILQNPIKAFSQEKVRQYTFGSASAAGAWYPIAVSMSKIITDNVPGYNVTGVVTPGASNENVMRIDRGEMELGWSLASVLKAAYNGEPPFKNKLKVMGWFTAYPAMMHVVALKSSGIEKISDLKGKKVSTDIPGQQTAIDAEKILFPAHGLTAGKDFKLINENFGEAIQNMIDGHTDALAFYMGPGVPGIHQIADSRDIVYLSVEESAVKKILDADPALYIDELPPNTYKGQKDTVRWMSMAYQLICSSELDEEFMYKATKAVWENKDFIEASNSVFKFAKIENVYNGMVVPIHPGAAKYFKERNIEKK